MVGQQPVFRVQDLVRECLCIVRAYVAVEDLPVPVLDHVLRVFVEAALPLEPVDTGGECDGPDCLGYTVV